MPPSVKHKEFTLSPAEQDQKQPGREPLLGSDVVWHQRCRHHRAWNAGLKLNPKRTGSETKAQDEAEEDLEVLPLLLETGYPPIKLMVREGVTKVGSLM